MSKRNIAVEQRRSRACSLYSLSRADSPANTKQLFYPNLLVEVVLCHWLHRGMLLFSRLGSLTLGITDPLLDFE